MAHQHGEDHEVMDIEKILERRIGADPLLGAYRDRIHRRIELADETEMRLTSGHTTLADFASGHEYFGLHFRKGRWVFREWAPHADRIHLKGSFSAWESLDRFALRRMSNGGVWEIELDEEILTHGDLYRLDITWPGGRGDRIPAWARRVVKHAETGSFNAQVWRPDVAYTWKHLRPNRSGGPLLVYETHIGMAQDAEKIGSYAEFRQNVLPRVRDAGYNTLQLMAVAEHPYYASFGYQVSSFFSCASFFGTPEELKALVDEAHGMGLIVLMDLVHSHAVKNEVEGLSRFDGTPYLYFHDGERGNHPAWDSRCFNYTSPHVLHFLLSNCRFWMDEYRFDGFRFDGITSMLYTHHGIGKAFKHYDDYFGDAVDESALAYLTLANRLVHSIAENAVTVAEDVSGMPGLAVALEDGGAGFDFRFAMGVPDYWIRLTKEIPDESWPIGHLWHELTNRRSDERTISYAESHDQAMVGDQTLIFRLMGSRIYGHMTDSSEDIAISRGIALHKIIRLATLATAGHGYLNFMGNEFGHPEWIDFPREGNQWSYHYARRQWHLMDDPHLRYRHLAAFDRDMTAFSTQSQIPSGQELFLLHLDEGTHVLAFLRAKRMFVFNFHPERSYTDYWISAAPGSYRIVLDTDRRRYGGFDRQDLSVVHHTLTDRLHRHFLSLYLPSRTAIVLEPAEKIRDEDV